MCRWDMGSQDDGKRARVRRQRWPQLFALNRGWFIRVEAPRARVIQEKGIHTARSSL